MINYAFYFNMLQPHLKYFIFLTCIIILSSCKKKDDSNILGLDVQPESDKLGITITDSVSLWMHTQRADSVRTFNDQYKFLGSNQDPIFGRTDASIYTNFSISNNLSNLSFGTNPIIDSAEIVMLYTGNVVGDTATKLKFEVYTLNEKLKTDNGYRVNHTINKSTAPINTLYGTVRARGEYVYLIIPLSKTLAQYILQNTSNLINNTYFQEAYKGFYITTENTALSLPDSGSIRQFDLDDVNSGVNLYYHNGNSLSTKGEMYHFSFSGPDALRFNHITHNYIAGSTQNLYQQVVANDSASGKNNIYLNTFGGTRVKVYLPYIDHFADSVNVSISRAELIVNVDEIASPYNFYYSYPSSLALLACGDDGSEELVYDQLEASDFVKYGGNYDGTKKQYVFNIARQMQKIITKKINNYGFYIVNALPNPAYAARRDNRYQRVVFAGTQSSNISARPKFKVTYIKYPYDK